MRPFPTANPPLQNRSWPPVSRFERWSDELSAFLTASDALRTQSLLDLRHDEEAHGRFLHTALATLNAYTLGYDDSPLADRTDDRLEGAIAAAKIGLERELIDYWLPKQSAWQPDATAAVPHSQSALADALCAQAAANRGVSHPLFDYLASQASARALRVFLWNEVVRNECVDDEVALLVPGTQGLMKSAVATNLYDECGRGRLAHFHTYWLRALLEELDWEQFAGYRRDARPWFAGITSNVFMMLLTRPAYRPAAYGCFLITEGWVQAHFERILIGMQRHGFGRQGRDIYFTAHVRLDPTHTEELIAGLRAQCPPLEPWQCQAIERGTRLAIAGAVAQYDRMLAYLRGFDG